MKVAFWTLGCKVNQYETQAMIEIFEKNNFEIVDFNSHADIYIINTCTVTNISDRKSRQVIKKAKKISPNSIVVVIGCYAQVYPEELKKIEDVDIIIGTRDRDKIMDIISEYLKGKKGQKYIYVKKEYKREHFEEMNISRFNERTRAFVKIQEGCEQFCSYCIIPYARGSVVSRDIQSIIDEIKRLVYNGFKEFVVTGINVSSYGKDLKKEIGLLDVLERISNIDGVERIRLSSIEPHIFSDKFIKRIASINKLCHHFHLSLQSGSDSVLERMNRHYTTEEYYNIVQKIKAIWPDVAITTDIMVGFPGETEEEFDQTCNFIKKVSFARIHVFRFSPKKGTKAYEMGNQIDEKTKEYRSEVIKKIADKLSLDFINLFEGKILEVLIEQFSNNKKYAEGYSDNYIRVVLDKDNITLGDIYKVKILKAHNTWAEGILV